MGGSDPGLKAAGFVEMPIFARRLRCRNPLCVSARLSCPRPGSLFGGGSCVIMPVGLRIGNIQIFASSMGPELPLPSGRLAGRCKTAFGARLRNAA